MTKNPPHDLETRLLLAICAMTTDAEARPEPDLDPNLVGPARAAAARRVEGDRAARQGWHPVPRLGNRRAALSRAVERLVGLGLVEASGNTRGRRVRLTAAGRELVAEVGDE